MSFGRLESSKKTEPMSEINVTPMVDVMLVLLVIFILTPPLLTSAIRLELPQGEGAQSGQAPQSVTLALNAQGVLFFNDQPVTTADLRIRLQETAQRNPETEVQLRADQAIAYGRVVEVMGLAQQAGLSRIGFVAEAPRPTTSR